MIEQKVSERVLNCTLSDLRGIEKFCIEFKEKYGQDLFEKLIGELLYFIIKTYIEQQGIEYSYEEFYDLQKNFTNPTFRFKISDFKDLELELMRTGADPNLLNMIINDLNYFLER